MTDHPVRIIGIPSANRAESLDTAARSYLENARAFGRKPRLVVADGSQSPDMRLAYKRLLGKLSSEFGVEVEYAGLEEKQKYARLLAGDSQVPLDLIEFALFNPFNVEFNAGANRNALLLHTTGELFVSVDDDTVCRVVGGAEPKSIRLSAEYDPTRVSPYPSKEDLLEAMQFVSTDFLGLQSRFIGKDVAGVLSEFSESEIRGEQASGTPMRTLVSWTGFAGDSGTRSTAFLYELDQRGFERFTRSEACYRDTLQNRQIHRAPDQLTVTPGGFCQSTALALDNREVLPPFLPALRGEDFSFPELTRRCFETCAFIYLPESILHLPAEARVSGKPDPKTEAAYRNSITHFFSDLLEEGPENGTADPCDRMLRLAESARSIVASDDFQLYALIQTRSRYFQSMAKYRALLENHRQAPAYWVRGVEEKIEYLKAISAELEYIPPGGLVLTHGPEKAFEVFQQLLARYFELVAAWPTLIRSARNLKNQGIKICTPLSPTGRSV